MATKQSKEVKIQREVEKWLTSYDMEFVTQNESVNPEIDKALSKAPSKTGGEGANLVDVKLLLKDTITIDMFGSAKYRNYKYGADDHVAVVHTEKNSKWTNLFLTTCIHNVANSGKFSYSRNFYVKDADELNIQLPVKNGKIDYNFMNHIGRAIEKMVIKGVVKWSAKRLVELKKEKNNV